MFLAQGHNTVPPVRLKLVTPQFQIEHSTTELPIAASKSMQRTINMQDLTNTAITIAEKHTLMLTDGLTDRKFVLSCSPCLKQM